jgi:formylglycine-generating enzyme required for sulfatase activity
MFVGIILGLVGWINQLYIAGQWRWWTVIRPYAAAQVWPHLLTTAQEQALKPENSFKECAQDCPEMVVVPAGSFTMGSPATEKGHDATEAPAAHGDICHALAVSKYELTFADRDACVVGGGCNGFKPNDHSWGRAQQPVINVNRDDARAYVAWLSQVTGKTYRLLSEAEYEYATRAGRRLPIRGATTSCSMDRRWPTAMAAAANGTNSKRRRSVHSRPTKSGCTTCWATFGDGPRIAPTTITMPRPRMAPRG